MPNTHAKHVRRPTRGRKPTTSVREKREVTPSEVVENLFSLFKRLEIDTNGGRPVANTIREPGMDADSHNLYPYVAEICELLTLWHQDTEYLDALGNPAAIRFRGRRPSFRHLVQRTMPRMDEHFLLAELERLGAVTRDERKLIHVHMRSLPMYEDKRLAAQHTLSTLDGFIRTLLHNLDSPRSNSDQLFHRVAWNLDFDSREIPTLKVRVKRHGQNFLESFDNWLARKSVSRSRKPRPRAGRAHVAIGVYLSVKSD
jgi:Family of unknown function (DUF6502)